MVVVIKPRAGQTLRLTIGKVRVPSVIQDSSPSALTPFTICSRYGISRSLGFFHAAPMQKRVEPAFFA